MKKKKNLKENRTYRKFLRFAGIGVQLGVMMYLASLLGGKVDVYYAVSKPWFSLLFIVLALFVFVWMLIKQLNKLNKE